MNREWRIVYQVWTDVMGDTYRCALENARGRLNVVDGHVHRIEVYELCPAPTLEYASPCEWGGDMTHGMPTVQ
jgi:hypothetical protein